MLNLFLGIALCVVVIPILEGFTALILSFFEVLKGKMAVSISVSQKSVEELQAPPPTRQIGFYEEIQEEEEDIDDL